jgi:phosphocarrier protein HPr
MIERQVEVVNRLGLHARAAAKLVHLTSNFKSQVSLTMNGEEVDAKSILGILLLAASQGSSVVLKCEGEDEQLAIEAIEQLFASRFEEDM